MIHMSLCRLSEQLLAACPAKVVEDREGQTIRKHFLWRSKILKELGVNTAAASTRFHILSCFKACPFSQPSRKCFFFSQYVFIQVFAYLLVLAGITLNTYYQQEASSCLKPEVANGFYQLVVQRKSLRLVCVMKNTNYSRPVTTF